eukprot:m.544669 g.544669  ORF g.544669 m.544669 type:complete len:283 (+) comp22140_c0_seq2:123-971(+)
MFSGTWDAFDCFMHVRLWAAPSATVRFLIAPDGGSRSIDDPSAPEVVGFVIVTGRYRLCGALCAYQPPGTPFFLGVAIYCYEGAGMIIALSTSVPKDHRHKFPRVFKLALAVITALYMFFGASGYISYGNDTEKIITLNMPSGPFPNIVKGCLCFSLFFTFPVMLFPVSTLLDKVLSGGTQADGLPIYKGAFLRSGLVGLSGIIVLAIPDFATIMGLIGSTCCMLLALILPGIFHLRIYAGKLSLYDRMFDYGIIALGVTGSILGSIDALERIFSAATDDEA